jgi:ferric-dicitrate binding protein FerR (iron transport regulator)
LVLERYGVTVLKLAQSKVVLKALLSPGIYTTSDAVAWRQGRLVLERYYVNDIVPDSRADCTRFVLTRIH